MCDCANMDDICTSIDHKFHFQSTGTTDASTDMVFRDNKSKKRGQRTANVADTAKTVGDLPDELLLKIMGDTATGDLLKFRQTSRVLVAASTTLLRSRLKVLYVHPTATSLRTTIEICYSDLATEIEEIALLGKVPWQEILKNDRDTRAEPERTRRESGLAKLEYLPWPARMPKLKLSDAATGTEYRMPKSEFPRCKFAEQYEQLLDALAHLPNARKLSFRSSCTLPGFNMISQSQIDSHTTKSCRPQCQQSKLSREEQIYDQKKKKPVPQVQLFSDADAIVALLDSMPVPFTALVVTDEIRYISEHSRSLSPDGYSFASRLRNKISNLISVEFHVTTGWQFTEWQRACHAMLALCAPQLQSLTLRFQHNAAVRTVQGETSLSTVIRDLKFPRLERLELAALLPAREDDKNWRPVCHMYNFAQFVENHRSSLSAIRLENVIFGMSYHGPLLLEQTRAILATRRLAGARENGDQVAGSPIDVTWLINHYTRDPRCKKEDTGAGHNCRHTCWLYAPSSYGGSTGCVAFRELAQELGATLDEEVQVWTFRSA